MKFTKIINTFVLAGTTASAAASIVHSGKDRNNVRRDSNRRNLNSNNAWESSSSSPDEKAWAGGKNNDHSSSAWAGHGKGGKSGHHKNGKGGKTGSKAARSEAMGSWHSPGHSATTTGATAPTSDKWSGSTSTAKTTGATTTTTIATGNTTSTTTTSGNTTSTTTTSGNTTSTATTSTGNATTTTSASTTTGTTGSSTTTTTPASTTTTTTNTTSTPVTTSTATSTATTGAATTTSTTTTTVTTPEPQPACDICANSQFPLDPAAPTPGSELTCGEFQKANANQSGTTCTNAQGASAACCRDPAIVCTFCPDGIVFPTPACTAAAETASTAIAGTNECNEAQSNQASCCSDPPQADVSGPPVPEVACGFCASSGGMITVDGKTVAIRDPDGDKDLTCEMAIFFTNVLESDSEECAQLLDVESTCCP
eukprot:CAMPEP_0181112336 /NCGR_PEP_ID=MMETSP1071-20121207/19763_1 /TAXON_ID=35127 /ORGANISM="Thalassiosira sp., Strain NH16" /LENGTH=425 /DNA_ID=CAMNT_0023196307 /DNA_START=48 /DNA_END=1325 /DNA_ORIENTATION=-